uniref:Uncharacterized protein n=1 Tax=Cyprinodon variegatus TaxID=28743 RepID=A0A3Q2D922_CYPVA
MAEGHKSKIVYEENEKKRMGTEERNKTRVFLGDSFTQWHALKAQVGLFTNGSVAKFALDR